jgi:hypothetical protein
VLESPAAFRFSEDTLFIGADTDWPDCYDQVSERSCMAEAKFGYISPQSGTIGFVCKRHATPQDDGRDYWPLAHESERTEDADSGD